MEVISVDSKVIKRLIRYCKPYRLILLFIFILSIISVLLTLLTPVLFGQAVDLLIGIDKVNMNALFTKLFVITVVIVLTALVQWLLGQLTNKITYKSTRHFPACSHNFPKAGDARFQGRSRLFCLLGKFPYLDESRRILMAVSSKTSSKTRFYYTATRRISSAAVQPSIWA